MKDEFDNLVHQELKKVPPKRMTPSDGLAEPDPPQWMPARGPHTRRRRRKDPGVAAAFSFFMPGLGHLYCENIGAAIGFFVMYMGLIVALSVAIVIGWHATAVGLALIAPVVWVCGMMAAYDDAAKRHD